MKSESKTIRTGGTVEGEVFRITSFGAFLKLQDGQSALIHISQIADGFVKDISQYLKLGDIIKARVLRINAGKIDLTLKKPKVQQVRSYPDGKEFRSSVFEDKLESYLIQKG